MAVVWLAAAVQAWADTLKIVPLVRDGQVLVSCHLSDAYTADLREVIRSGLRTTFTYTVELRLKVPMWVDRIVESAVVTTTVQYRQPHAPPFGVATARWPRRGRQGH